MLGGKQYTWSARVATSVNFKRGNVITFTLD
jgi:hypothetical protein